MMAADPEVCGSLGAVASPAPRRRCVRDDGRTGEAQMTRSKPHSKPIPPKPLPARAAAVPPAPDEVEPATEEVDDRIVSRPDGWYWIAPDGKQEVGPFDTLAEAQADMDSGEMSGWAPDETLAEAESEIGVSDWIDPESGEPAEGQSPPHLRE